MSGDRQGGGGAPLEERAQELTFARALSLRATSRPNDPFVVTRKRRMTFGEVEAESEALAASLGELGIGVGDRTALVLPGCPEFVVGTFALAKLGAVAVPLDPRLTPAELRYTLRNSGAECAIVIEAFRGTDYLEMFQDFFRTLPDLHNVVSVGDEGLWYDDRVSTYVDLVSAGAGRDYEAPPAGPDDLFAIVYTSGRTEKLRGVELTHRSLAQAAAGTADAVGLARTDVIVGVSAPFHAFGLGPGILGAAISGASLVLQEEFDAADNLELIARHRATVHFGVPTVFAAELAEQRATARNLSSLRIGLVAGAPMAEALFREVQVRMCPVLLSAYSITEISSTVCITRPDDPAEKRRYTVGRPLPGVRVRVFDDNGAELPEESLGELAFQGAGVMRGYHRQPQETASSLDREGFFRTGDLGIVDEEGFVHLVGRKRSVILRSGSSVYPREIEVRLHAHPAVQDVVVVGVRDPLLGEAVCASIVPLEGAVLTEEELRAWCRETLADYKVPDVIHFLDELPVTGTGKVRRVELVRLIEEARHHPSA